jgi:hypothetical protein
MPRRKLGYSARTHFQTILNHPRRLGPILPKDPTIADVKYALEFFVTHTNRQILERGRQVQVTRERNALNSQLASSIRAENALRRAICRRNRELNNLRSATTSGYSLNPVTDGKIRIDSIEDFQTLVNGPDIANTNRAFHETMVATFYFTAPHGDDKRDGIKRSDRLADAIIASAKKTVEQLVNGVVQLLYIESDASDTPAELSPANMIIEGNVHVEIYRMTRNGAYNWSRPAGEFMPYILNKNHGICKSKHILNVLASIGLWTAIDRDNYDDACIAHAFKSPGASEAMINALKEKVVCRAISLVKLRQLANDLGIFDECQARAEQVLPRRRKA